MDVFLSIALLIMAGIAVPGGAVGSSQGRRVRRRERGGDRDGVARLRERRLMLRLRHRNRRAEGRGRLARLIT